MSNNTFKKIALYTLGTFTGIAVSLSVQSVAETRGRQPLPVDSLRTMAEVYSQVKANYYQEKTDEEILEGALKGMVSHLDPHSEYMNLKDYADMQESTKGEFGGLGMEVGSEDGFVKVVSPIEDTPAERAGIQSGDYIIKIDDASTRNMSVNDAVKRMRGEPGTKITLTLTRKDAPQPIVVTLTRAVIKVRSVRHDIIEPGYGYLRISQFQERTVPAMAEALQEMRRSNGGPLKGLVLDLRDDPGGLLNGAVGVSSAFLQNNQLVVSTKGRDGKENMSLKATPADYQIGGGSDPLATLPAEFKNIPITVLINSGSASASEIVAGALQDHKRAVIVGTQSFGKGSVQSVMPLSNGGALKITTQLYYTPNGRSIQAQGIMPDVEVADKTRRYESREADLSGHLSNPNGGNEVRGRALNSNTEAKPASEPAAKEEADNNPATRYKPNPAKDDQLRRALELVKTPQQWRAALGQAATRPAKPIEH
ncbi:S41 family peptidase [Eikenella sp. S3360]|uniref:S41 family peptidase n=1 Tax=Eikenella glucosivorans TaxID=2766967 RepID=A0ABS0NC02_9NEIS|nr:S41 family peptidase [Eikenella glucosivorans]MBH5329858.1 S41 family peptidase [Eikenella glucosivorans]